MLASSLVQIVERVMKGLLEEEAALKSRACICSFLFQVQLKASVITAYTHVALD